jgi:hypothetical protein
MNFEYRIILAFGAVCVGEDVEGVVDIARSSYRILDGVGDVRNILSTTIFSSSSKKN